MCRCRRRSGSRCRPSAPACRRWWRWRQRLVGLSISKSNAGTVTSTPAGVDCDATCAAKFGAANTVTLTAAPPPPGLAFVGWNGACAGASPSCTLTLNADTKVQASFTK